MTVQWLQGAHLDPNDPDNFDLLELQKLAALDVAPGSTPGAPFTCLLYTSPSPRD